MYRVLIVDDDVQYASGIEKILKEEGYFVISVDDPVTGIEEVAKTEIDLVISDYNMETMNGLRFLSSVKSIRPSTKCMLLTGFPSEEIESVVLDMYIDCYLSKDKSLPIIKKYIRQTLEAEELKQNRDSKRLISGPENIVVDLTSLSVYKNNELVSLTRKEYEILKLLLQNKGIALSREEIVDSIWTQEVEAVDLRIVDGHIKKLRHKLKTLAIMSIRGYGYKWSE